MIPLKDENPTRIVPYVVYFLIAANILVYIIDISGSRATSIQGFRTNGLWNYSMVPAQILRNDPNLPVIMAARVSGPGQPPVDTTVPIPHPSPTPVWITIFTSMFLHGGLLHLAGNMLYLWIFGNNIEDVLGHVKFIFFYLAGGVAAALAHIASNPASQIPTVGASGAIAAVLGAYLVLFPTNRVITLIFLGFFVTTMALPAVVILGYWIVIQIFSATSGGGMTPGGGVAYWAHIGGFAFGILGILLLGGRRLARAQQSNQSYYNSWYRD